jgi:hypothetical protein
MVDRQGSQVVRDAFTQHFVGEQCPADRQLDVVLPNQLVGLGDDDRWVGGIDGRRIVYALAEAQGAGPRGGNRLRPGKAVYRGLLVDAVVEGGAGVVFVYSARLEQPASDLAAAFQLQAEADAYVLLAEPVPVGWRAQRIVAGSLEMAALQVETQTVGATRDPGGGFQGTLAADSGEGLQVRCAFAVAGEDLDHAADRVGSVKGPCRAAQDLDPIDLGKRDHFERSLAGGRRAEALAIEQQQGMSGIGPAHEDRRGSAGTTSLVRVGTGAGGSP